MPHTKNTFSYFKSVKKIINSKEKRLTKINQLGDKKAKEILKILEEIYEE